MTTKEEMLKVIYEKIAYKDNGIVWVMPWSVQKTLMDDVLERLKINEHIAYNGMSWGGLRLYIAESRRAYQHIINAQEYHIIEHIYNLCKDYSIAQTTF